MYSVICAIGTVAGAPGWNDAKPPGRRQFRRGRAQMLRIAEYSYEQR